MDLAAEYLPRATGLASRRGGMIASAPVRKPSKLVLFFTTGDRLYWTCQFASWTFFYLVNFAIAAAFTEVSARIALYLAIYMLAGLEITQRFRLHVRRRGWIALHWSKLIGRVLTSVFAMALVHTLFTVTVSLAFAGASSFGKRTLTLGELGGIFLTNLFNMSVVFGVWAGCYFAVQSFRQQRRAEMERLRLETNLKEAELRALKSQVNPHFLFNSLNSLRALIDEDAPRAREAVTRLANMLRYSLQSGQLETVPFEDELRIVEDYLALEQIRHESRLRVRWTIADHARSCGVPPMLLQTLVENAVKYGIGPRRDGGEITIAAEFTDGELTIRVTNPGDLSAPASTAAARAGSSTGVGLRNASERLKLLFGGRARLSLSAEPAGLVTATVTIPCAFRS